MSSCGQPTLTMPFLCLDVLVLILWETYLAQDSPTFLSLMVTCRQLYAAGVPILLSDSTGTGMFSKIHQGTAASFAAFMHSKIAVRCRYSMLRRLSVVPVPLDTGLTAPRTDNPQDLDLSLSSALSEAENLHTLCIEDEAFLDDKPLLVDAITSLRSLQNFTSYSTAIMHRDNISQMVHCCQSPLTSIALFCFPSPMRDISVSVPSYISTLTTLQLKELSNSSLDVQWPNVERLVVHHIFKVNKILPLIRAFPKVRDIRLEHEGNSIWGSSDTRRALFTENKHALESIGPNPWPSMVPGIIEFSTARDLFFLAANFPVRTVVFRQPLDDGNNTMRRLALLLMRLQMECLCLHIHKVDFLAALVCAMRQRTEGISVTRLEIKLTVFDKCDVMSALVSACSLNNDDPLMTPNLGCPCRYLSLPLSQGTDCRGQTSSS